VKEADMKSKFPMADAVWASIVLGWYEEGFITEKTFRQLVAA
jgi:hypothetical protein